MFMATRHTCSTTSAHDEVCHPQTTHSALLTKNTQKPAARRDSWLEATNHDAATVATMAGHCTAFSRSIRKLQSRSTTMERRPNRAA